MYELNTLYTLNLHMVTCVIISQLKKRIEESRLNPRFQTGLISHLVQRLPKLLKFFGPSDQIKSQAIEQNVKQ